jgi:uncharacterized phage-like protein YoqJ
MLKGITIPHEPADEITVATLKETHKSIQNDILSAAANSHQEWQVTNLRDYHETMFAIEKVLKYFAGENWDDN